MSAFNTSKSSGPWQQPPQNRRASTLQTPSQFAQRTRVSGNGLQSAQKLPKKRPDPSEEPENVPLIPLEIIDAPSQRRWIAALYAALWGWKIYDFHISGQADGESIWLFIKWLTLDSIFLFSLPALRIPWMEWPPFVTFGLFLLHAAINALFMFQTGLPFAAGIMAISKAIWGRELGLSDRRVNPQDYLFNSSLIVGKQVVYILPEGSAILNPEGKSYCLSAAIPTIEIPIQINQTSPIGIEFVRFDFEKDDVEVIALSSKETKKLVKESKRRTRGSGPNGPLTLLYKVNKPGVYRLKQVIDESKLEVRLQLADTYVVQCPEARIKYSSDSSCTSDLSDLNIQLLGTPPFRISYRRTVNNVDAQTTLVGVQPGNFTTPLQNPDSLDSHFSQIRTSFDHVRQRLVSVPINDTLLTSGMWTYIVEEITDGLFNVVNYVNYTDEYDYIVTKPSPVQHSIQVHSRPEAWLRGCDSQNPIMVAQGQHAPLPVVLGDEHNRINLPLTLDYVFTPESRLLTNGDHDPAYSVVHTPVFAKQYKDVLISEPGLYSLVSVSSSYCSGDIIEPSSCNLQNSPLPDLTFTSEKVFDTCAGQSTGLRVHIRLIGTPPFVIHYDEVRQSIGKTISRSRSLRDKEHQIALDLIPRDSGTYSYVFTAISDAFYRDYSIEDKQIVLKQTVEPVASAFFDYQPPTSQICLGDSIQLPVELGGLGPWDLDYDFSFGNKRTKMPKIMGIESSRHIVDSGPLLKGGEYTFALASVVDARKCPSTLDVQLKVNVRMAKPKVAFKPIQGKFSTRALDGNDVPFPLVLSGYPPFTLAFRNIDDEQSVIFTDTLNSLDDQLVVRRPGTYELLSFHDSSCPGIIDSKASRFEISMVPRPSVSISEKQYTQFSEGIYAKKPICEGAEDFLNLVFAGQHPFSIQYEAKHSSPSYGRQPAVELEQIKEVTAVRMDSTVAGEHEYRFFNLLDHNYPSQSRADDIIVQQTVYSRPTAQFVNPGKTYRYCASESSDDQVIPIILEGVPPFSLEIEIRHSSYSQPEQRTFQDIETKEYGLRIPNSLLRLGNSNIIIRSVTDDRRCGSRPDNSRLPTSKVQISLHEAPSITSSDSQTDYCVGDSVSFSLSGKAPFKVFLSLNGQETMRKEKGMTFSRIADSPGVLQIVGIQDSVSMCKASTSITKNVHPRPVARISRGQNSHVDIHKGSGTDLTFDFDGTPPFEFTYVRSSIPQKGRKSAILQTYTATSLHHSMSVKARDEGSYEVITIKDKYCSYSKSGGRRS